MRAAAARMRKRHTPPWSTYLIGRPPLPVRARQRKTKVGKERAYTSSLSPLPRTRELQENRGNAAAIAAAAVSDGFEQGRKDIDTFRLEGTERARTVSENTGGHIRKDLRLTKRQ